MVLSNVNFDGGWFPWQYIHYKKPTVASSGASWGPGPWGHLDLGGSIFDVQLCSIHFSSFDMSVCVFLLFCIWYFFEVGPDCGKQQQQRGISITVGRPCRCILLSWSTSNMRLGNCFQVGKWHVVQFIVPAAEISSLTRHVLNPKER